MYMAKNKPSNLMVGYDITEVRQRSCTTHYDTSNTMILYTWKCFSGYMQ